MSNVRVDYINFARDKQTYVLKQIRDLKSSDFAYADSQEALTKLEKIFEASLSRLDQLPRNASKQSRISACTHSNLQVARFLPILGFVLRSTNVRNSFELYWPLTLILRTFLGGDAKIVLSSEWDFSPLTYDLYFPELADFVLIGLPVSESGNALLVPLAGHEIGHSVWRRRDLEDNIKSELRERILSQFQSNWIKFSEIFGDANVEDIETDIFLNEIWSISFGYAIRQCEEVFCDVFGLRLFGTAYLHAFSYLLAPYSGEERSPKYPDMPSRAKFLEQAALHFGFDVPENYHESFDDKEQNLHKADKFIQQRADKATEKMIPRILQEIDIMMEELKVPRIRQEDVEACVRAFQTGVPTDKASDLAAIINGGWTVYIKQLESSANGGEEFSLSGLNELVLKSIEVMEFEESDTRDDEERIQGSETD